MLQPLPAPLVCISHGCAICSHRAVSPCTHLGFGHSTPEQCPLLPSLPCMAQAQEQCFLERQESSACQTPQLLPGDSGVPKMGKATVAARGMRPGPQQNWAGAAAPPAPAEITVGSAPAQAAAHQTSLRWSSSEGRPSSGSQLE